MALVFTVTRLTRETQTMTADFNMVEDTILPLVAISSGQVRITIPAGLAEGLLRNFINAEITAYIQRWYNAWRADEVGVEANRGRTTALNVYINNNITR